MFQVREALVRQEGFFFFLIVFCVIQWPGLQIWSMVLTSAASETINITMAENVTLFYAHHTQITYHMQYNQTKHHLHELIALCEIVMYGTYFLGIIHFYFVMPPAKGCVTCGQASAKELNTKIYYFFILKNIYLFTLFRFQIARLIHSVLWTSVAIFTFIYLFWKHKFLYGRTVLHLLADGVLDLQTSLWLSVNPETFLKHVDFWHEFSFQYKSVTVRDVGNWPLKRRVSLRYDVIKRKNRDEQTTCSQVTQKSSFFLFL